MEQSVPPFPPKELKEEVFGRKDVKVDKTLRGSWKYSGEHRDGRQGASRSSMMDILEAEWRQSFK